MEDIAGQHGPDRYAEAENADQDSQIGGEPQGEDAERRDPVDGEAEHLRQRELGLPREARRPIVEDRRLLEPEPGHHAADETVRLAQLAQHVDHAAAHQAEVARVERHLDGDHRGEQPVEPLGGEELEARLPGAGAPAAIHDLEAFAPAGDHLQHHLGRILQVRVHHHDRLAVRVIEAGGDRGLVAEVPRDGEDAVSRLARGERAQQLERVVLRSVVDEDHLCLEAEPLQELLQPRVQSRNHGFFVVDGKDEAQLRPDDGRHAKNVIRGRSSGSRSWRSPGGDEQLSQVRSSTARSVGKLLLLCCAALALVPLLPSYLPLVDFPQHVALQSVWQNIGDPAYDLGGRFQVTLVTPYALPHLLAHAAAQVLGPEGGLRFVLALSLAAFPLGALTLLRSFGRPAELALAAAPAALSFVYWYGFTSYVMALPLVLAGIGYARRCALSGRMRDLLVLGALGLVTVATHGFAFLVLLLLGGVAALEIGRASCRER